MFRVMSVDIDIIEQMFEYSVMSPAVTLETPTPDRGAIETLQQRIRALEAGGLTEAVFPVSEPLRELFPDGGLRRGIMYQCDSSASLVWSLLAEASSRGIWCALVGLPDMGIAAAQDMGVNVDRLVLVPYPGEQWLPVVGALSDVVGIIALGPVARPSDRMTATLMGRLRERDTTLLVSSTWPKVEANIRVTSHHWEGLGRGHGMLSHHRLGLSFTARHGYSPRRCDVVIDAWGSHSTSTKAQVTDIASYRHAG
jgi:hypothetical protein